MDFWPMQGELGSKHWGNRLPGSGGTAGPEHQNGFLIKESENPFRQAWLGKKHNVSYEQNLLRAWTAEDTMCSMPFWPDQSWAWTQGCHGPVPGPVQCKL